MKLKRFLRKMKRKGELSSDEVRQFTRFYVEELGGSLNDELEQASDELIKVIYSDYCNDYDGRYYDYYDETQREQIETLDVVCKVNDLIIDYFNNYYVDIKENTKEIKTKTTTINTTINTEWKSDFSIVDEKCPYLTDKKDIFLSPIVIQKILYLLSKFPSSEWLGLLKGRVEEDKIYVDDMVVPPQKNTIAHTEINDEIMTDIAKGVYGDIIGWIHSHNNMSVFFSGEDKETAMKFDVSIVVNNKFEFKAVSKKKLPCGKVGFVEGKIRFGVDENFERDVEKNVAVEKTTKLYYYRGD